MDRMSSASLPSVTPAELSDDAILLDVREPDEWAAGHAPGALHVPLGQIPAPVPASFRTAPTSIVVCHVGSRSARATAWLNQQGYACRNLTGGMVGYAAAGRPLVSDTGAPPVVD